MYILGIDTSCDDTCIAIIEADRRGYQRGLTRILSNVISSQVKLHAKYGGVYPFLAKREHQRNLPSVLKQALLEGRLLNSKFKIQNSKLQFKIQNLNEILSRKIDFIGVTVGPGLEPCLWQGVNFAKKLAEDLKLQIISVNHIEAHILANFIGEEIKNEKLKIKNYFPAVCLVVSGGHTQLILMKAIGKYKLIGETRDDAAGECFDKCARILGLGYPGGPAIAKMANKNGQEQFLTKLPRPMIYQKNYDFSFSGLKTAVLYDFQSRSQKERKSKKYLQAMAFEIQQAVIDVLIHKTIKVARDFRVKSIILGGGVVANEELRKQFNLQLTTNNLQLNFFAPAKKFCTDNGAMIALTGFFHREKATRDWQKIKANANLKI